METRSGGALVEEFGGDSFGDGDEAGGEASAEEGFEFVELGEFLADGVGAFCVVGVVEGQFSGRGPSVGAGVVASGQVIPGREGWGVWGSEEVVHSHLLVAGGVFQQMALDLIEQSSHSAIGAADEEAGVDIREAGRFALECDVRFRGLEIGKQSRRGQVDETDVDI